MTAPPTPTAFGKPTKSGLLDISLSASTVPVIEAIKPNEEKVARNFVMYSRCSGHFVPGGIDHIFAVLVMPTHWKLIETCQIYCYEDNDSEIRKFGISKDHRNRAKQTKRKAEIVKERNKKKEQ